MKVITVPDFVTYITKGTKKDFFPMVGTGTSNIIYKNNYRAIGVTLPER